MILRAIYNFFSRISEGYEELRSHDGEIVDVSVGRLKPEEVVEIALSAAIKQEWVGKSGQPDLTADKPTLFHHTRREQFVWTINFDLYFTEEQLNTTLKNSNYVSVTMAAVKIDDANGEIIFADFIRGHFNEYYEPANPEAEAAYNKKVQKVIGAIIAFLALCGNIGVWAAAFFYGYIYEASSMILPGIFIMGLGLNFFDKFAVEQIEDGEDVGESNRLGGITAGGWTVIIAGISAGFINRALLSFLVNS